MENGLTDHIWALARISHHLTVEARDRPAITSLRLLAVLNVLPRTPPLVKRRAPRTDGPLTHFASPRGEKSGLDELLMKAAYGLRATIIARIAKPIEITHFNI